MDRERQPAPPSTSHPERAQRVEHLADRTLAACAGHRRRRPRRSTGRRPAARTASRCRPARSRPRRRRSNAAGVTATRRPSVSTVRSPAMRRAAAISVVSREPAARRTTEGPSASAASTSARLVSDLLPGSETTAVHRRAGAGRRPGVGERCWSSPAQPMRRASADLCCRQPGLARAAVAARRPGLAADVLGRPAGPPGDARLALGVDRGDEQPAEHRDVLEEVQRCWAAGVGSDSSQNRWPATVVGTSEAASTVEASRGARPVASASAGAELDRGVDPHQRHRVRRDRRVGTAFLTSGTSFSVTGAALAARASRRSSGRWRRRPRTSRRASAGRSVADRHGSFLTRCRVRSGDRSGHPDGGAVVVGRRCRRRLRPRRRRTRPNPCPTGSVREERVGRGRRRRRRSCWRRTAVGRQRGSSACAIDHALTATGQRRRTAERLAGDGHHDPCGAGSAAGWPRSARPTSSPGRSVVAPTRRQAAGFGSGAGSGTRSRVPPSGRQRRGLGHGWLPDLAGGHRFATRHRCPGAGRAASARAEGSAGCTCGEFGPGRRLGVGANRDQTCAADRRRRLRHRRPTADGMGRRPRRWPGPGVPRQAPPAAMDPAGTDPTYAAAAAPSSSGCEQPGRDSS